MATTVRQDQDFMDRVISRSLLEDAIEWIAKNLSPDQVFSEDDLSDWALSNGFIPEEHTT